MNLSSFLQKHQKCITSTPRLLWWNCMPSFQVKSVGEELTQYDVTHLWFIIFERKYKILNEFKLRSLISKSDYKALGGWGGKNVEAELRLCVREMQDEIL